MAKPVLLVALAVASVAACAGASEPPPKPALQARTASDVSPSEPAPAPAPTPAPPPPPATEPPPPPKKDVAWTDPAVVAGLAKSCTFRPEEAKADPPMKYEAGVLSCAYSLYEQSCVSDPCYATDQRECKPKCEKSCTSCDQKCETACEACKKPCTDDSCKHKCAESCGGCKPSCLTEKDRCSTGTCGQAYAACNKRLEQQWKASGCPKACPKYNECASACDDAKSPKCRDKCRVTLAMTCPEPFTGMCMFNGRGPGNPETTD